MEYGAGGLPAHYEALAIRILGLPASRHLLDAMFDGMLQVYRKTFHVLLHLFG